MKHFQDEVERSLKKIKREIPEGIPEAYVGGKASSLRFLGLKVPTVRKLLRQGFSFSSLVPDQQAKIWDYIWKNSETFEAMSLALDWHFYRTQVGNLQAEWKRLKGWSERIDNWAHSDTLSGLYARFLEKEASMVYPTLKLWNTCPNPWQRRLSIVSLLFYYRFRERVLPPSKIFPLVKAQLTHPHHYVQKGVGWTLRELTLAYPRETREFLDKHLLEISSVAFTAAIEKLSAKEKGKLKEFRRKARRKNL